MSMQKKPQMVEAVVFFNDRGVCREMLYPEFEALLDSLVQMPEYADRQMQLAYVLINPRLLVKAVVFFYLDFDEQGEADPGWNLPLRNLADRAGRGPDMGGGPIRLACRSQCPVSWHQMHLWDPTLDASQNHLVQLRDAIRRNHLGLLVEEEPAAVELARLQMADEHQWYAAGPAAPKAPPAEPPRKQEAEKLARLAQLLEEHQQKTAELLGQHEARLSQVSQQHEQELSRLKLGAQEQVKVLQAELASLREGLKREEEINAGLRRELDGQANGFQRGREELTAQLRHIEQSGRDELEQLRQQIEEESRTRMASLEARYKEQVSVRDVELGYRNELDQQLQQENQQLRREAEQLREETAQLRQVATQLQQGAESLRLELDALSARAADGSALERLAGLGVIFVVYHPGAGHLTLSLQDVARYQENPMAYAAAKCFVAEDQYRSWLAHYQQPACEGRLSNGERCALPLDRVDNPRRASSTATATAAPGTRPRGACAASPPAEQGALLFPDWRPEAPLQRIHLGWLERAGVELALLRLDQVDPLVSGNKWFKLAPHLALAPDLGLGGLMTLGGAHSNHLHAVAAAGARFGFETVGLLRGEEQSISRRWATCAVSAWSSTGSATAAIAGGTPPTSGGPGASAILICSR